MSETATKIEKLKKAMSLPGISAEEKAIYQKAIDKLEPVPAVIPISLEKMKVYNKAFKTMPGSPKQKKILAEIKELDKKEKTDKPKRTRDQNAEFKKKRTEMISDFERQMDKIKNMSEEQVIAAGLRFNEMRNLYSQVIDNSSDNIRRLSPTPENLLRWMQHPGKFDLIGVDTFKRSDPTKDYKSEIHIQKFWHRIYNIKHKVE